MDSKHDLLQSEVRSFFTPVSTNMDSTSKNPNIPKFDIFEPAAPQSKTIIVKCEKHGNSETTSEGDVPNSHADSNGVYRLERLDSSVNPDVTAKLDRMAQKLGFNVPSKSNWADHSPNSDCEDLQLDDAVLDGTEKPEAATGANVQNSSINKPPVQSTSKRSFFATIMKRLSSRPKASAPHSKNDSGDKHANRSRATSEDSRPLRIRRWFTKRLWSQKSPERKETGEGSMASAGAVLEGNFGSSLEHVGSTTSDTSLVFPKKLGNLPTSQSSHSGPTRGFASLERLTPLNGDSQREVNTVNKYSNGPSTAEPYSSGSQYKALTLPFVPDEDAGCRPPVTVSFSQTSLLEDTRKRSTGVKQLGLHDGSFLSRQACGSEGTALHMTSGAPALATSRLPSGYTPSYVSVSVAAFGYSGYSRTSLSSGNLDSAQSGKRVGLTLAERAAGITTPRSAVAPRTPPVSLQTSPHSIVDQHPDHKDSQSPLRVEVTEPADSHTPPHTDAEKELGKTTPNAEQLSGRHPTSNRPTSKVLSQSPCSSPVGNVSESASGSVRLRRTRTRSQTGNSEDQEHWHRSSLIMLAVAHASPRGRLATSLASPENSVILPHTDGEDPTSDPGLSRISNGINADAGFRSLTHSYHESILEEPNEDSKTSTSTIHSSISPTSGRKSVQSDVIDGRYFLRITDEVQAEIVAQIDRTEADLATAEMDEEVSGLLRTAVGKAKLLISEKFVQFRNLCQQNLDWIAAQKFGSVNQTTTKSGGPDLVTLVSDLDGFWAMVMLQVDDVRALLAQVDQLRANGWKQNLVAEPSDGKTAADDSHDSLKTPVPKSAARKPSPTSKAATRSRDDTAARAKARERLAMAKREMRARQLGNMANATQSGQSASGEDVFIIV